MRGEVKGPNPDSGNPKKITNLILIYKELAGEEEKGRMC